MLRRDVHRALPVHDLLAEDADWDAETWAMEPDGLEALARTLEWLCERLTSDFEFFAAWPPECIDTTVTLSIQDLAAIVRGSRIGTKTRYLVRFGDLSQQ